MRASAAETEAPTRIGPYRIAGTIGAGGMGVVYVGQEEGSSERVAIKTVRVAAESDLGGIRREIHALRGIRHRGVVRIVAEGVENGLPWYAMELLEGETLERRLESMWRRAWADEPTRQATESRRQSLTISASDITVPVSQGEPAILRAPPEAPSLAAAGGALDEVLALFLAMCEPLAFLHGEGIVHRDLKPSNVFLRDGKAPVLVDFGLVLRVQSGLGREVLDGVVHTAGTPAYMAPELIQGGLVDARTDLYALGCILYEAITGSPPFTGATTRDVLQQHVRATPVPASERVDGVPPALDALLERLLEKRPRDRLGHADDVAGVLAALLGPGPAAPSSRSPGSIRVPRAYVYRPELVGRDDVLGRLREHLSRLLDGRGGFALVGGESGLGKTHLATELARVASGMGIMVVTGSCVALGGAEDGARAGSAAASPNDAPLHPFSPVLQAVADRCLSQGPEVMREILGDRAKVLAAVEPGLARLPGHDAIPEPRELAARAARDRLLGALRDTLSACGRRWPLLVVLDDLQWADELSMELFASLAPAFFAASRVLVLGMYRPEDRGEGLGRLLEQPGVQRVDLGRLGEGSVRTMVAGMLALDAPPERFVRFLVERSAGNPFFVAEYVRTAVAEGLLYRTPDGRWQLDGDGRDADYERLPLPVSLRELVAARLARLGPAARELAEVASVVGREAGSDLLAEVAAMAEYAAMEALRELIARQVIEDAGGGRLRFLHAKLRETAYEGIPAARRRALHLRVGRAIEARHAGSDALPLRYAELASHFTQAAEVPAALQYLELAGELALANFANQEAIAFFGDLLVLDAGSPATLLERDTVPGRVRRARWERRLCEAHRALGDLDAMCEHASRALRLTGHEPPSSRAGWALGLLWNIPVQAAHRLAPRAFVAGGERRELLREAAASMEHLSERFYFLDAVAMVGSSLRAVNLAERAGGDVRVAMPYGMLGLTAGVGKLAGLSRRYFALAESAAGATSDARGIVHVLGTLGTLRSGEGDWGAAREVLERALAAARRRGDPSDIQTIGTILANADHFTGRFGDAKRFFLDLAHATRAGTNQQHLAWGLYGAARSMIPLGEIDDALPLLEAAEQVLSPQIELPSKIITFGLLATAYLERRDLGRALSLARRTTATIGENMLAAYAIVTGYAGAAEVYLANLRAQRREGAPRAAVREAAREVARASRDLRTLAYAIPIGRPYHLRFAGRWHHEEGRSDRARRAWEQALAEAERLGMPHDAAVAHRDLAGLEAPGSAARRGHLERARAIFAGLSCAREVARTDELALSSKAR